ncbi:MAG TPA: hypothetical protein VFR97_10265 [Capillimicrobium sp.]|nr:hypothetical protein [Capillimicrobium sp.]
MADAPDILAAVNDYLIGRGIARDPRTPDSALPPLWVEEDVPAPGERGTPERGDVVLGAQYATGIPTEPFRSDVRWDGVAFIIRVLDTAAAITLHARLRDAFLHGAGPGVGGHLAYDMAGRWVLECREWTSLQPLERTPQGRTFTCEFQFQTYA